MEIAPIVGAVLFIAVLVAIFFERNLNVEKAALSTVLAFVLWTLRALTAHEEVEHEVMEAAAEVVGIFLFLFAAMLLVEVLDHKGFFDLIRRWLYSRGYTDKKQLVVICVISFFLSAILDNLTTTLVMVTIALRFFDGRNMWLSAAGIITAANAGGAWSAIGDVTTIMMWVDGKFSAREVAQNVFLPSLVSMLVTTVILSRYIKEGSADSSEELVVSINGRDWVIIWLSLGSFSLPLIAHVVIGIPPFLGIFGGAGLVWLVMDRLDKKEPYPHEETHLQSDIIELMRKLEYPSLVFFAGIILSVKALGALGVLSQAADLVLGDNPSEQWIITVMVILGWVSAVVDNIPLTALAMDTIHTDDPVLWSLLAYTVGTGGSHLLVGSAAGIVAMGKVKGISSTGYFKMATLPIFVGYVTGVVVWVVQYTIV